MIFEELIEFKKDLKALLKKYRSIQDDLDIVKKVLAVFPDKRPPFSFRINNLDVESCVIKVKKIACKSLKGRGVNSEMRIVYAYFPQENKILFIEIYHKGEKEKEDRLRIKQYFEFN